MKLIKFYSRTCQPCKTVENPLALKVIDLNLELINVDVKNMASNDRILLELFSVQSIPTIIVLDDNTSKYEKVTGIGPILAFLNVFNKKYFIEYETSEI